jgi:ubiquinone/menaquinone biosynthesis C-methylase UbiE
VSEATGERLEPAIQHGELVHAEHLARYRVAAGLAQGRKVLDAACGEGYGSALLASAGAASVTGIDIDEATVVRARDRYGLSFEVADVASLPFPDAAFDLVVSFETIEHVADPEAALAELTRIIAPAGLLVISTPNKHEYLVPNEFHVREFTHEEFAELLGYRFAEVRWLFQHNWNTSAVLEEATFGEQSGESPLDLALYKVAGGSPGRELYSVAVCGDGAMDVTVPQVAVLAGVDEAHELARRLLEAERVAGQWHSEYEQAKKNAELWHREWEKAKHTVDRLQEEYHAIAGSRVWRWTEPLRRVASARRRRRGG